LRQALAHCFHFSAKRLRRLPEEYAKCFGVLRNTGILFRRLSGAAQAVAFSRKEQRKRGLLETVFAILARDGGLGPFPHAKISKDARENLNPGISPCDAEAPRAWWRLVVFRALCRGVVHPKMTLRGAEVGETPL
jgi:hypothetical protein